MMKTGLIVPNNRWFCPYVSIYTDLLDRKGIAFDIITWCRDGKDEAGCIQYRHPDHYGNTPRQFLAYLGYAAFVRRQVRRGRYDRLVVFAPQVGIFISSFLRRRYKGKYIFDYRDLSIEQKSIFRKPFRRLLDNSAFNVISSPGFRKYLPEGYEYMLSHNFNIDAVRAALSGDMCVPEFDRDHIDVLTIGGIRDYDSNVRVMDSIAGRERFSVRFVGKGPSAEALRMHAAGLDAGNISFEGYYPKSKEAEYVSGCTFLNIFYPRLPSHDTALSNRFYISLIHRRPMITTAGTTQGDYASQYGVGVAVENCDHLPETLEEFLRSFDAVAYSRSCNRLLESFLKDYNLWESRVSGFLG